MWNNNKQEKVWKVTWQLEKHHREKKMQIGSVSAIIFLYALQVAFILSIK